VQAENRIDKYITERLRQHGDVPLKLLRKLGFVNAAVLSGLRAVLYSSGEQLGRCWKQSSKIVREQETWIIERQAGRQAGRHTSAEEELASKLYTFGELLQA
jgi:hypothetical protein